MRLSISRAFCLPVMAVMVCGAAAGAASADPIYQSGHVDSQITGSSNDFATSGIVANNFTLTSGAVLTKFVFTAITNSRSVDPSQVTLRIYKSDGTGPDEDNRVEGGLLDVSAPVVVSGAQGAKEYAVDLANWTLDAGNYYVGLQISNPAQIDFAWAIIDDATDPGDTWHTGNGVTYHPEAGDNLFRFEGTPVPSVPEPASWALMLGGFGLVGSAMRSRRRVTVRA